MSPPATVGRSDFSSVELSDDGIIACMRGRLDLAYPQTARPGPCGPPHALERASRVGRASRAPRALAARSAR